MPKKTWAALTSRKAFLDSYGEDFSKANGKKAKDDFFTKFYEDYFEKYHWSLDDKVEPAPGAVYNEPQTPAGLEAKEKVITEKKEVRTYLSSVLCGTQAEHPQYRCCVTGSTGITIVQVAHADHPIRRRPRTSWTRTARPSLNQSLAGQNRNICASNKCIRSNSMKRRSSQQSRRRYSPRTANIMTT
jgi:hypothetical protein